MYLLQALVTLEFWVKTIYSNYGIEGKDKIKCLNECTNLVFSVYNGNVDFISVMPKLWLVDDINGCIYTSMNINNVVEFHTSEHNNTNYYQLFPNLRKITVQERTTRLVVLQCKYLNARIHVNPTSNTVGRLKYHIDRERLRKRRYINHAC